MSQIEKIESLIRQGDIQQASEILDEIKISDLDRSQLKVFSNFAVRVQNYLLAIRILSKVLRDHKDGTGEMEPDEILVYVSALIKIGLFKEANKLLEEIDSKTHPKYFDLTARMAIAQWDYKTAGKHLEKYLSKIDKNSYPYLVGQINLASAHLTNENFDQAQSMLEEIENKAKEGEHNLILGNCYELLAQTHIKTGRYEPAKKYLDLCLKVFDQKDSIWSFYAKKWYFFMDSYNSRDPDILNSEGEKLLSEAKSKSYHEDVREIERHIALCLGDDERLLRVFIGTPYPAYRKKMVKKYGISIPSEAQVLMGPFSKEPKFFDHESFYSGQAKLLSCFEILLKDFFKPLSLGYIFDHLFKDEHFDPDSSPQRVYALVRRLRESLPPENNIDVIHQNLGTHLVFNSPTSILIKSREGVVETEKRQAERLRSHFKKSWFTTSDVAKWLDQSSSSAKKAIDNAGQSYVIEKQGKGRATRYRFK